MIKVNIKRLDRNEGEKKNVRSQRSVLRSHLRVGWLPPPTSLGEGPMRRTGM